MPAPLPNIWQMQSQGDIDGLIETLHHPDAAVRRRAVASLRALKAWHAIPALEGAQAIENDWQTHAAISEAIEYLDHDVHAEQLVKSRDWRGLTKMLNSTKLNDVLVACQVLSEIGDQRAIEALIILFRNPLAAPKARLAAAEALLKLKSAPSTVALLGALRREDWQARRNAAAVLGQLNATWAVEPLTETLNDEMPIVRKTASAALRRIGTAEAIAAAQKYDEAARRTETSKLQDASTIDQPTSNSSGGTKPLVKSTGPVATTDTKSSPNQTPEVRITKTLPPVAVQLRETSQKPVTEPIQPSPSGTVVKHDPTSEKGAESVNQPTSDISITPHHSNTGDNTKPLPPAPTNTPPDKSS